MNSDIYPDLFVIDRITLIARSICQRGHCRRVYTVDDTKICFLLVMTELWDVIVYFAGCSVTISRSTKPAIDAADV